MVGQADDKEYVSPTIIPPRSGNFFPGAGRLFVSLLVSPLFSADRSPATPIGLDKWPVLGGTCHLQAPDCLLE